LKAAAAAHKAASRGLGKAATRGDWATHADLLAARNAAIAAEKDMMARGAAAKALEASGLSHFFETSVEVGGRTVKVVPVVGFALGLASGVADGHSAPQAGRADAGRRDAG